jgi:hypothetical protein
MKLRVLAFAWLLSILFTGVAPVSQAAGAATDARVALVIGNATYKSSPLKNPVNDARAIGRALQELGFEVMLKENLSQQALMASLREFGNRLKQTGGVGLFYYAGHGMQVKGANYLIPVDADIASEDEVRYLSVDANQVLDKMEEAGNRLNIVILDACRDNPFSRSFRSRQSGLAQMDAPSGMLVAFATAPGAVAYDGDGVNGVYTKHLLRNITIPGLPIELVLKRVREGVSTETGQKQIPWESSSLLGDFYFKGAPQAGAPVGQADAAALELAFWDSVKNSNVAAEYQAYLEKYPSGQFAALARSRMNTLLAQAPATGRRPPPSANVPAQVALAQPSSASTSPAAALARVGDSWTYDLVEGDWLTRRVDTVTMTVTALDGEQIRDKVTRAGFRSFGATRTFKAGFDPGSAVQETELPGKYYLMEFSPYLSAADLPIPGKEWKSVEADVSVVLGNVFKVHTILNIRALAEERVRVPAGEFSSVKVQVRSQPISVFVRQGATASVQLDWVYWYSQELCRVVKMTRRQSTSAPTHDSMYGFELAGFQTAK